MKNVAVILAAGSGSRTGLDIPKQFLMLAGKYVLEHSVDTFCAHPKIEEVTIVVASEYMDKVFERFYRVDKARSRQTGGRGLGLSITKNIILLHKGTIKLYSKENEGTTFTVRVPLNYVGGTTI